MDKIGRRAHQRTSEPSVPSDTGEVDAPGTHGNDLNLGTGEAVESASTSTDTAIGFDDTGSSRTGADDAGAAGYSDSAGLGTDGTPVP